MAMVQKRVQVTLPPDVYDICYRISDLGGVSLGGLLGQLISENKEGLQMIADALEAAKKKDTTQAIKKLRRAILVSDSKSTALQSEILDFEEGETGADRQMTAGTGSLD